MYTFPENLVTHVRRSLPTLRERDQLSHYLKSGPAVGGVGGVDEVPEKMV